MNQLEKICADKRKHVDAMKAQHPPAEMARAAACMDPPRGFLRRLEAVADAGQYPLICEMKRASPSGGLIRPDFDAAAIAKAYEAGGAACLSVLTDAPYFKGRDEDLPSARSACTLPVLRKDFIIDPYQIAESRVLGADCVLLILAALDDAQAKTLEAAAIDHGMDVLIETHDAQELQRSLRMRSRLVGINNRNLRTLQTDLATTEKLARDLPDDRILVSESGIRTAADLARLSEAGADAFLIGESLLRERDLASATRALLDAPFVGAEI